MSPEPHHFWLVRGLVKRDSYQTPWIPTWPQILLEVEAKLVQRGPTVENAPNTKSYQRGSAKQGIKNQTKDRYGKLSKRLFTFGKLPYRIFVNNKPEIHQWFEVSWHSPVKLESLLSETMAGKCGQLPKPVLQGTAGLE